MTETAYDTVIRNGTVVTAGGRFEADVAVSEGRVAALGRGLARGRSQLPMPGMNALGARSWHPRRPRPSV